MKRTLSYSLWPEPPAPITMVGYRRSALKAWLVRRLASLAAKRNWQIVEHRHYTSAQREEGQLWPMQAHTMIGWHRLCNLQQCMEDVLANRIPGDFIETGVWRGGACILKRAVMAAYDISDRRVFVADSFQGLPEPDPSKHPKDARDKLHTQDFLAVSRTDVEDNFRKYGLLDEQVHFLEGWFKDTLPTEPIERLAVMRLDGDMYGSTIDALTALYPKLSTGGYCIIDDYALPGAREATNDFRQQQGIRAELKSVDFTGVFWQKP